MPTSRGCFSFGCCYLLHRWSMSGHLRLQWSFNQRKKDVNLCFSFSTADFFLFTDDYESYPDQLDFKASADDSLFKFTFIDITSVRTNNHYFLRETFWTKHYSKYSHGINNRSSELLLSPCPSVVRLHPPLAPPLLCTHHEQARARKRIKEVRLCEFWFQMTTITHKGAW